MNEATNKPETITVVQSEREFYGQHEWCLNPIQSVDQLFRRIAQELDLYSRAGPDWQREEVRINVFLLTCAVSCTVADHLAPVFPSLKKLSTCGQRLRPAVRAADRLLHLAHRLRNSLLDRSIWQWKRKWDDCVEVACRILVDQDGAGSGHVSDLRSRTSELSGCRLPEALRRARMQLPSGFRAQDLTHHDVLALADAFAESGRGRGGPLAVVGIRTAGAYFAPLMKVRLQSSLGSVSWISVRPKKGLSTWEWSFLRAIVRRRSHVVIVDDHPDTGETLRLMIDLLGDFGIGRQDVTVLVPSHPAQKDRNALTGGHTDVCLVTLPAEQAYKCRLLTGGTAQPLLQEYLAAEGCGLPAVVEDPETEALNRQFEQHWGDGFHVKVKKVFGLQSTPGPDGVVDRRIFAKGVGWGWLGYHAYLTGTRLAGFVPKVLGLRHGVLFSDWIEPRAGCRRVDANGIAPVVGAYVAARATSLRLEEDPCLQQPSYGGTGWYMMAKAVRRAFGPYLGRIKMRALWAALQRYASPLPTFTDGQMRPEEWLDTGDRILKVDYEHHGFGNPSPNIVDPAYDLAAAAFQLELSAEAQERMIRRYIEITGDRGVRERLILYKLVVGHFALEAARYFSNRTTSDQQRKALERNYLAARNFLTFEVSRFWGERFFQQQPFRWSDRLFFIDLDGVFDCEKLLFPHTTVSGIEALLLLRQHDYSVVPNTGRSVEHVRCYCSAYALPGGIAEYGCVFVDAIANHETVLIDDEVLDQLGRVRALLAREAGVLLDPGYHFGIRAYRIENGRALSLPGQYVGGLLHDFPRLASFSSSVDSYFFAADGGKGPATVRVMQHLSVPREKTAAIGDSEVDLPMLESVGKAYVPANARRLIQRARRSGYRVLDRRVQQALLQAAEELTVHSYSRRSMLWPGQKAPEHLLEVLLSAAERSTMEQIGGLLRRDRL